VCAICERIAETPVGGISEVAPAGLAGAGVWRYQDELTDLFPALKNIKARATHGGHFRDGQLENLSERRRIEFHSVDKCVNHRGVALDLYRHARRRIEDETAKTEGCGKFIDERPETDSLNDPSNVELTPDLRVGEMSLHIGVSE
jgi:hypothetical protein